MFSAMLADSCGRVTHIGFVSIVLAVLCRYQQAYIVLV